MPSLSNSPTWLDNAINALMCGRIVSGVNVPRAWATRTTAPVRASPEAERSAVSASATLAWARATMPDTSAPGVAGLSIISVEAR